MGLPYGLPLWQHVQVGSATLTRIDLVNAQQCPGDFCGDLQHLLREIERYGISFLTETLVPGGIVNASLFHYVAKTTLMSCGAESNKLSPSNALIRKIACVAKASATIVACIRGFGRVQVA